MKKEYESPTLEIVRFSLREAILASVEDIGGGGDQGNTDPAGEFGDDGWD